MRVNTYLASPLAHAPKFPNHEISLRVHEYLSLFLGYLVHVLELVTPDMRAHEVKAGSVAFVLGVAQVHVRSLLEAFAHVFTIKGVNAQTKSPTECHLRRQAVPLQQLCAVVLH